jgi:hypothetical protein
MTVDFPVIRKAPPPMVEPKALLLEKTQLLKGVEHKQRLSTPS